MQIIQQAKSKPTAEHRYDRRGGDVTMLTASTLLVISLSTLSMRSHCVRDPTPTYKRYVVNVFMSIYLF